MRVGTYFLKVTMLLYLPHYFITNKVGSTSVPSNQNSTFKLPKNEKLSDLPVGNNSCLVLPEK